MALIDSCLYDVISSWPTWVGSVSVYGTFYSLTFCTRKSH